MDYIDIRFALLKKGYSLTRIAREMKLYGPQSVHQVLTRKYISARVEEYVCNITEIPLKILFPDRYGPNSTKGKKPHVRSQT